MKRLDLDTDDLIKRYLAGTSEKSLGELYGVARTAIRLRLIESGVAIRDRSAAMYTRMANTSAKERARLSAAAHVAASKPRSEDTLANMAILRQNDVSRIGQDEPKFSGWLTELGCAHSIQLPIGRYNADFATASVAVELWASTNNPMKRPRCIKKTEYFADRGWPTIWVWVGRDGVLIKSAAQQVVALLERIKRDPPTRGQYWVVRGSGKLFAAGQLN